MIAPMLALLYTLDEFAALRETPKRMREADLVGVWHDGKVKVIRRPGEDTAITVTVSWQRWREMMEKEEAHGP